MFHECTYTEHPRTQENSPLDSIDFRCTTVIMDDRMYETDGFGALEWQFGVTNSNVTSTSTSQILILQTRTPPPIVNTHKIKKRGYVGGTKIQTKRHT